jgi:uncharacterized NAD(P)/FAD-binding protein YdhS
MAMLHGGSMSEYTDDDNIGEMLQLEHLLSTIEAEFGTWSDEAEQVRGQMDTIWASMSGEEQDLIMNRDIDVCSNTTWHPN